MCRGFESLLARTGTLTGCLWWVWRSWLARQIVALEALGSSPSTHPVGLSPSGKATAFDAVIPLVRIQLALLGRLIRLYWQQRLPVMGY